MSKSEKRVGLFKGFVAIIIYLAIYLGTALLLKLLSVFSEEFSCIKVMIRPKHCLSFVLGTSLQTE